MVGAGPAGLASAAAAIAAGHEVVVLDRAEGAGGQLALAGGDPAGLDAAEVLAAAGAEIILAVASVTVGESVHAVLEGTLAAQRAFATLSAKS